MLIDDFRQRYEKGDGNWKENKAESSGCERKETLTLRPVGDIDVTEFDADGKPLDEKGLRED